MGGMGHDMAGMDHSQMGGMDNSGRDDVYGTVLTFRIAGHPPRPWITAAWPVWIIPGWPECRVCKVILRQKRGFVE
ncbi:Uncharacterised protein [Leclercia adecarboxylata]|uniref:Copper resistance protein A n=1 Tax=Leclercia adecarboxylata TaxID=83655 RepID=A0A4U9IKB5_9ENTR|nr:Uncharacterised protein [Leclercia adecarboxylata]